MDKKVLLDLITNKYNKYSRELVDIDIKITCTQGSDEINETEILNKLYKCMKKVENSTFTKIKARTDSNKYKHKDYISLLTNKEFYKTIIKGPQDYKIDKNKAELWINSQFCDLFRQSARAFIENTTHISHKEIVINLKKLSDTMINVYPKSVVILGSSSNKSNYFFGILFMMIMYHEHGLLPYDITEKIQDVFNIYSNKVNYIDIDDMMYTGTQTTSSLQYFLVNESYPNNDKNDDIIRKSLIPEIAEIVCRSIGSFKYRKFVEIINKLPDAPRMESRSYILKQNFIRFLTNFYLLKSRFNYYLIRPYMSTYSLNEIKKEYLTIFPITLVNDKRIPHIFSLITKNVSIKNFNDLYKKNIFMALVYTIIIYMVFNMDMEMPKVACYSDYKVADLPSTFLLTYTFGPVPSYNDFTNIITGDTFIDQHIEDMIEQNIVPQLEKNEIELLANDILDFIVSSVNSSKKKEPVSKCIPFIKNCNLKCIDIYNDFYSWDSKIRCPDSWYKHIHYPI
jgi:hypothetical protein